jgi:peptidoglycan/LPS O-acetylase OafA/YrhL
MAFGDPARKDFALEGLRGVASVSVLVSHLILGFYPEKLGDVGNVVAGDGIRGEFWYGLVYGRAAVTLFFVLSGYVLTLKFLASGGDRTILINGSLKRWPRLAAPALISILFCWWLLTLGFDRHAAAAAITHSQWLAHFGNAKDIPTGGIAELPKAVSEGLFTCFIFGEFDFNTNLWTMRYELVGSFVAFALAAAVIGKTYPVATSIVAVCVVICHVVSPFLAAFPIGVALALWRTRNPTYQLSQWIAIPALVFAYYLFGYTGHAGHAYAWLKGPEERDVHIFAAVLAMASIELCPAIKAFFSSRLSGYLGRISFPLYLVHLPIIFTLGSALLVATGSKLAAALAVMISSFALATAVAPANDMWVRWLNKFFARPRTYATTD